MSKENESDSAVYFMHLRLTLDEYKKVQKTDVVADLREIVADMSEALKEITGGVFSLKLVEHAVDGPEYRVWMKKYFEMVNVPKGSRIFCVRVREHVRDIVSDLEALCVPKKYYPLFGAQSRSIKDENELSKKLSTWFTNPHSNLIADIAKVVEVVDQKIRAEEAAEREAEKKGSK